MPSAPRRCGCWRRPRRRMALSSLRRRHRSLHHARLPLQGRRPADDQLPSAAARRCSCWSPPFSGLDAMQQAYAHAVGGRLSLLLPTATPACSTPAPAGSHEPALSLSPCSSTDAGARLGEIATPRGVIRTPAFMPVGTAATVKGRLPRPAGGGRRRCHSGQHLSPDAAAPAPSASPGSAACTPSCAGTKPILTDSGGFQVMSLAKLRKITDDGVTFQSHIDGSTHTLTPERRRRDPVPARGRHPDATRRVHRAAGRATRSPWRCARSSAWAGAAAAPSRQRGSGWRPARPGAVRHRAGRHRPGAAAAVGRRAGGDGLPGYAIGGLRGRASRRRRCSTPSG